MVILRFVLFAQPWTPWGHGRQSRKGCVILFSLFCLQNARNYATWCFIFWRFWVPRGTQRYPCLPNGDLMTSCHVVLSRRLAYEQIRLGFPRDRGRMSLRIYYKHPSYGNQFVSFVFCWCYTSCRFPCKGKN